LPALTILMTHFNCDAYLKTAIDSILSQTFTDFELLIVDDTSPTDAWLNAAAAFSKDRRLKLYRTTENVGPYRIKNRMLDRVDSTFLAFHDADDFSHPLRLEKQMAAIRTPNCDVVGTSFHIIDETGTVIGRRKMAKHCNFWRTLGRSFLLLHPTMLTRTSVMRTLGGFDGETRIAGDDEFVFRALHAFDIRNLPLPLYYYRKHGGALTVKNGTNAGSAVRRAYIEKIRRQESSRRKAPRGALYAAASNNVLFDIRPV